ncbi:hypothetical protein HDU76_000753 [Blyttiomyces sp. JEL0837]|nr:hypothetical protein HDU76_000753 [Blyttiomyces sp. JEL0837]
MLRRDSIAHHLPSEVLGIIFKNVASTPSSVSDILPPFWNLGQDSCLANDLVNIKIEDARRRSLAVLEPCARVCKAWSGPALSLLYRRVDLVVGFGSGVEKNGSVALARWKGAVPLERLMKKVIVNVGHESIHFVRHRVKVEVTELGRLVREVHVWSPPLGVDIGFDEFCWNEWNLYDLDCINMSVSTFRVHNAVEAYFGYQPCRCRDPEHVHHGRGLEGIDVRCASDVLRGFTWDGSDASLSMYQSLRSVLTEVEGPRLFYERDEARGRDPRRCNLKSLIVEQPISFFDDLKVSPRFGKLGIMDDGFDEDCTSGGDKDFVGRHEMVDSSGVDRTTKLKIVGDIVRKGVKEVSLRQAALPLTLNELKNVLQGVLWDTGVESGSGSDGLRKDGSHGNEKDDDNFSSNTRLIHLDLDLNTPFADLQHVIKAVFDRAPMIESLTLDRWVLNDVDGCEAVADSIMKWILAVKPSKLKALVLPPWTFRTLPPRQRQPQPNPRQPNPEGQSYATPYWAETSRALDIPEIISLLQQRRSVMLGSSTGLPASLQQPQQPPPALPSTIIQRVAAPGRSVRTSVRPKQKRQKQQRARQPTGEQQSRQTTGGQQSRQTTEAQGLAAAARPPTSEEQTRELMGEQQQGQAISEQRLHQDERQASMMRLLGEAQGLAATGSQHAFEPQTRQPIVGQQMRQPTISQQQSQQDEMRATVSRLIAEAHGLAATPRPPTSEQQMRQPTGEQQLRQAISEQQTRQPNTREQQTRQAISEQPPQQDERQTILGRLSAEAKARARHDQRDHEQQQQFQRLQQQLQQQQQVRLRQLQQYQALQLQLIEQQQRPLQSQLQQRLQQQHQHWQDNRQQPVRQYLQSQPTNQEALPIPTEQQSLDQQRMPPPSARRRIFRLPPPLLNPTHPNSHFLDF